MFLSDTGSDPYQFYFIKFLELSFSSTFTFFTTTGIDMPYNNLSPGWLLQISTTKNITKIDPFSPAQLSMFKLLDSPPGHERE